MKQSLQLTLGQQLTLTPQLQQAIRLLQLSTLDLQHEIQLAVDSNPLLNADSIEDPSADTVGEAEELSQARERAEEDDFQWSHRYTGTRKSADWNERVYHYEHFYGTTTSLQDHLRWQVDLTPLSDVDRVIATAIIDAMDEDGFLTLSLKDIHTTLNCKSYPLEFEDILAVAHRVQHLDPVGCGTNSLSESLLVQLQHLPPGTPYLALTESIVGQDLLLLGQHKYGLLMKRYHIKEATLHQVLQLIHRLNPKPGSVINAGVTLYTIPDVLAKKMAGVWKVVLNQASLPHLSINMQYAGMIKRANNNHDNQFLKSNLQEARWFLKSIQTRQETLLKVASYIVKYQHPFFEMGEEAMKPLILSDVANALGMHESTISRVTTQKFLHTPRGMFELKYFFSSHVGTQNGGECSSTAIRAVIKKLIAEENHQKPISDNTIAQCMGKQGIRVARRTITKYRETMDIPASRVRKLTNS